MTHDWLATIRAAQPLHSAGLFMEDDNDGTNGGAFRKWVDVPVSGRSDDSVLAVFKKQVSCAEVQVRGTYARFKECRAGYLKSAFNGDTVAYADLVRASPNLASGSSYT